MNDSPVARDDAATCSGDAFVAINVLANDRDADGDTLEVVGAADASTGSAELGADGVIVFRPHPRFEGEASFVYTIRDGEGAEASATAYVQVLPADECPDDPAKTDPGACGCGAADTDDDGNGIPDCLETHSSTITADPDPDAADRSQPAACGGVSVSMLGMGLALLAAPRLLAGRPRSCRRRAAGR